MLSQYANSPNYVTLYSGLCNLFNNAQTLEDWYNIVFNLKTAQGYGLDMWGAILNQGRLLHYTNPKLIDISLKDGNIFVRSGSIIWFPNGANFMSSVLPRDYDSEDIVPSSDGKYIVFIGGGTLKFYLEEDVYAGSEPTPINQDAIWYDTINNLVKITEDGGTTWDTVRYSLPVGRITVDDNEITTIDNIFNGFGYFGSAIFALPGVSGYTPNGLNDEGQKQNEFFEIEDVTIYNNTSALSSSQYIFFNTSVGALNIVDHYYESSSEPTSFPCLWYDLDTNLMKYKASVSDSWTTIPATMFAEIYGDGTSINPTNINVADIYLQKDETVYLQGAQTIDGVPYTAEQIEEYYRMVLFLKAMSNITNATLASINGMFAEYFDGEVFAYEYGVMKLRIVCKLFSTKIVRAIFTTLLPKPTGVLLGLEFLQPQEYFGFNVAGLPANEQPYAPADQKPFYW